MNEGKVNEAVIHFKKALQLDSDNVGLMNNLAFVLAKQGKFDEAISYYLQALQIKPDYAHAHYNLALVLQSQGKLDEAAGHCRIAVQIKPVFIEAHNTLGSILTLQGKLLEAIDQYHRVLDINPDDAKALNNLARILATDPNAQSHNPEQAIQLAQKACELTNYRQPDMLDTLAAAYAADGRFSDAVTIAERARELANSLQQTELIEQIQNNLRLYKAGQR
jgi:tetratricopeptide (TPR) repeat protein